MTTHPPCTGCDDPTCRSHWRRVAPVKLFEPDPLIARVADLERRLCESMAAVDRARSKALEEAAKAVEAREEWILHCAHRDGLGMGSQCCEHECREVAKAIRALKGAT